MNGGSTSGNLRRLPLQQLAWSKFIPEEQWNLYRSAFAAVRAAGLRFMIGGGFGLAAYVGRWRNTKDIDFYVFPEDRQAAADVLAQAGFVDYYDQLPYDRGWIYRSTRAGVIVDVIWSMANRRAMVDDIWFHNARPITVRDELFDIIPPEELIWSKLYVLQPDHSDWPDVFNMFYAIGPELNWDHLLDRLGPDVPVLQAALTMFNWIAPNRLAEFPGKLRRRLQLPILAPLRPADTRRRVKLLDSRGWFAALQPKDKPLEI